MDKVQCCSADGSRVWLLYVYFCCLQIVQASALMRLLRLELWLLLSFCLSKGFKLFQVCDVSANRGSDEEKGGPISPISVYSSLLSSQLPSERGWAALLHNISGMDHSNIFGADLQRNGSATINGFPHEHPPCSAAETGMHHWLASVITEPLAKESSWPLSHLHLHSWTNSHQNQKREKWKIWTSGNHFFHFSYASSHTRTILGDLMVPADKTVVPVSVHYPLPSPSMLLYRLPRDIPEGLDSSAAHRRFSVLSSCSSVGCPQTYDWLSY